MSNAALYCTSKGGLFNAGENVAINIVVFDPFLIVE